MHEQLKFNLSNNDWFEEIATSLWAEVGINRKRHAIIYQENSDFTQVHILGKSTKDVRENAIVSQWISL